MLKEPLEKLAYHYDGKIQFAWVADGDDELLKLSFEAYKTPRSNFIIGGKSYGFEKIITGFKSTKKWIDEMEYLKSPQIFKAPKRIR